MIKCHDYGQENLRHRSASSGYRSLRTITAGNRKRQQHYRQIPISLKRTQKHRHGVRVVILSDPFPKPRLQSPWFRKMKAVNILVVMHCLKRVAKMLHAAVGIVRCCSFVNSIYYVDGDSGKKSERGVSGIADSEDQGGEASHNNV